MQLALQLTSMVLSSTKKRVGAGLVAFDAHNHIHLSKLGGIPPLDLSQLLIPVSSEGGDEEENNGVSLLRHDDANWDTFVNEVAESLHLRHHRHREGSIPDEHGNEHGNGHDSSDDEENNEEFVLGGLALMSTQPRDFPYVHGLGNEIQMSSTHKIDVVKCYGVHPWFLHQANEDFEHYEHLIDDEENDEANTTAATDTQSTIHTIPWLSYLRHKIKSDTSSQVGEIGLDGARYDPITKDLVSPMNVQVEAFEAQMHLAADMGRTVSVHAVRAWGPLMDAMRKIKSTRNKVRKERKAFARDRARNREKEQVSEDGGEGKSPHIVSEQNKYLTLPPRVYFHAFGGKAAIIDQLDAICRDSAETFYGFAPIINFRSHKTASVIQKVGIDRLVLESDLEDHTGVMRDLKANVKYIAEALEMDENNVLLKTSENARRLYQLDNR